MSGKNATIRDVAKLSGVSIATVSRVVNSAQYPVSAETREKVENAVKELNFHPNVLGQYLQRGETNDIGVIVPNLTDGYYITMVEAFYNAFIDSNCNVALYISYRNPSYEEQLYRSLIQKRVKAIIVVPSEQSPKWLHEKSNHGIPVVVIGQQGFEGCHSVTVDYYDGGYRAGKYLSGLGHKEIAIVGPSLTTISRKQRLDGFFAAMAESDIVIPQDRLFLSDNDRSFDKNSQYSKGINIGGKILNLNKVPSAVFVLGDTMALGVLQAMHLMHVDVPTQMSIIGFGNELASGMSYPELSTIDPCAYAVAQNAAEYLMMKFMDTISIEPKNVCINPILAIRQSTAQYQPPQQ